MAHRSNKIFNREAIRSKIVRIAYQILENNFHESQIFLVGIQGGGSILASEIKAELSKISDLNAPVITLSIDKKNPIGSQITLSSPIDDPTQSVVILIDDVLNSGKTMFYAMRPFVDLPLKKLETAFLVNRAHRRFPIAANYTGIELATTLQEHITFSWEEKDFGVYLE